MISRMEERPQIINAVAPIRICDIGGWTDTWFAEHGNVLSLAVYPYVEVQLRLKPRKGDDRIHISLENYGDSYSVTPGEGVFGQHPLIEAAIEITPLPEDIAFDVNIYSKVPPGASTGTSAAVSVALIGAIDRLTPGRLSPHEIATLAHRVETDKLGLQSGIQDQMASAHGGVNYIQMYQYPNASVSRVDVPNRVWWELEHRLALVYIGTPHSSSEVHRAVIAGMGTDPSNDARLQTMRELAGTAKDALYGGDFALLASVMNDNTEAQRQLHSELVCDSFEEIIQIGKTYGGIGFKVNGAGGDGGSITILTQGDMAQKRKMLSDFRKRGYSAIDIYLSRYGLRVWTSPRGASEDG